MQLAGQLGLGPITGTEDLHHDALPAAQKDLRSRAPSVPKRGARMKLRYVPCLA